MALVIRGRSWTALPLVLSLALVVLLLTASAHASIGDQLPEFKECVEICKEENCGPDKPTHIPLLHRLLLWTCDSECDHTCQHIVTSERVEAGEPVVQFHGKWPFTRILGMQEPCSVIFSLANLYAHLHGLGRLRKLLPRSYPLRPYYETLALVGITAWTLSAIFHTRDFPVTEQADYFGAGASVLYGLYVAAVRIFRLDGAYPAWKPRVLKWWTRLCIALYVCHVGYLKGVRWDYGYNMAANVVVGIAQNVLWSWFSWTSYRRTGRLWTVLPGVVVAWVVVAMSLELLDFPPIAGALDAHSLWHLGTVGPTVLMYNFLIKDSQEDLANTERLKS